MKVKLERIKRVNLPKNMKAPDYDGFFRTPRGDFYVVGWLKDLSSDMDLKITKVDNEFNENMFNRKRYAKWLLRNPVKK